MNDSQYIQCFKGCFDRSCLSIILNLFLSPKSHTSASTPTWVEPTEMSSVETHTHTHTSSHSHTLTHTHTPSHTHTHTHLPYAHPHTHTHTIAHLHTHARTEKRKDRQKTVEGDSTKTVLNEYLVSLNCFLLNFVFCRSSQLSSKILLLHFLFFIDSKFVDKIYALLSHTHINSLKRKSDSFNKYSKNY